MKEDLLAFLEPVFSAQGFGCCEFKRGVAFVQCTRNLLYPFKLNVVHFKRNCHL